MSEQSFEGYEEAEKENIVEDKDMIIKRLEKELKDLKTHKVMKPSGYSPWLISTEQIRHLTGVLNGFLMGEITDIQAAGMAQPSLLYSVLRSIYHSELEKHRDELKAREDELISWSKMLRESKSLGTRKTFDSTMSMSTKLRSVKSKRKSTLLHGDDSMHSNLSKNDLDVGKTLPQYDFSVVNSQQLEKPFTEMVSDILDSNKDVAHKIKRHEDILTRCAKEKIELMTKISQVKHQIRNLQLYQENEKIKQILMPTETLYDKFGDPVTMTEEDINLGTKMAQLKEHFNELIYNLFTNSVTYNTEQTALNEEMTQLEVKFNEYVASKRRNRNSL